MELIVGVTRHDFLNRAATVSGAVAVGIFAFPQVLEAVEAVSASVLRVTRPYTAFKVATVADLVEGEPVDYSYPLVGHLNFVIKLGTPAWDGVGLDQDIVSFNYLCSHIGCPLIGKYNHDHKMLDPCPCHFSRFYLAKKGVMILGQATQSLPQVTLEVRDGDIFAVAVSGLVYGYRSNLQNGTPVSS